MFGRVLDTSVEDTVWLNGYQLFTVVVIWCKDWFNSYSLHMVANIIRYLTRIKKDREIKKRYAGIHLLSNEIGGWSKLENVFTMLMLECLNYLRHWSERAKVLFLIPVKLKVTCLELFS